MTYDEARKVIGRITYKPEWMLVLQESIPGSSIWYMWATLYTRDAVDGGTISLESRVWLVDSSFPEDHIIETAFLCIRQMEEHEMMEFFKVDGFPVYNPHLKMSARKQAVRESFDDDTLASMGVK